MFHPLQASSSVCVRVQRLSPLSPLSKRGNANSLPATATIRNAVSQNQFLQVVLVSPQIPGNAGCIARTCAASAVGLHLVGPLGFKVDDTKLKRAGLDYWPKGDYLIFGSETCGLPCDVLVDCKNETFGGGTIRIPMVDTYVRCLNLSVSVGIALYEASRQLKYEQLQGSSGSGNASEQSFLTEDIFA
ncbi:tRNA/rRNA methyltransferase, SpoU [Corchorus capsularis]|uniref:tRNA/rRNA methyltransferase, SpoU n=1 Tax=Corchorus capsularis TaxID=210143 RepID=A0A1R3HHQ4_COCAP|nr:tRNA/rRNA methyltransferase, SpoU [Corchorus capsularis]